MTATEAFNTAKKAVDETTAAILNDILSRIETAANKGEFSILVGKMTIFVQHELASAGYAIEDVSDVREGSTYQISWNITDLNYKKNITDLNYKKNDITKH